MLKIYKTSAVEKKTKKVKKMTADCWRAILAKQLNISPQQMKYVTHTEACLFYTSNKDREVSL